MALSTEALDRLYEARITTIARDLKLNLKRLLEESALGEEDALLVLLATATSVESAPLASYAREQMTGLGIAPEIQQEAAENAAILGMLNVYYRFRHMVQKDDDYRTASLRMTGLARPAMGKERFELLAFAVSVLNGCESCIRSHEKVLRDANVPVDKIHDAARMAAVVKGLKTLG